MPSGTAPGGRSRLSGAVVSVGQHGYSYSSSTIGIQGICLNFNMSWAYYELPDSRAHGFQLRCLSE
nr:hypothetical protein [uncultured Rikenella sp.]